MDEVLDKLGFAPYNDGSGDYGDRRLISNNKIRVIIMDMVEDYWTGELPECEYYFVDGKKWECIENEQELLNLMEDYNKKYQNNVLNS